MKKISVIISCYNAEDYIDICMNNLLNQTIGIENIEILLIDDASTDGTLARLKEFEERYPENILLIINEKNKGLGASRNIALNYASGEYIAYCDADDWFSLSAFEFLYNVAKEEKADVVEFGYQKTADHDGKENQIYFGDINKSSYEIFDNEARAKFILGFHMDIVCWNKIYKREMLTANKISFMENAVYEEPPFSQMIQFCADKYVKVDLVLYYYYQHPGSLSTKFWENKLDMFATYCRFFDDTKSNGIYNSYPKIIDYIFWMGSFFMPMLNMASKDLIYSKDEFIMIQNEVRMRVGDIRSNPYFLDDFSELKIVGYLSYGDVSEVEMDDVKALFKSIGK